MMVPTLSGCDVHGRRSQGARTEKPGRFRSTPNATMTASTHHNTRTPGYSYNNTVVQNGHVLGADPDRGIRFELRRDGRYWLYD